MFRKLGILAILLLVFCGIAFADFGDEATIGGQDSDNVYRWRVNSTALFPGVNNTYNIGEPTHKVNSLYSNNVTVSNSVVTNATITNAAISNATLLGRNVEVFVTGDTLTAEESGKICINNLNDADGYVNFTLPTEATGLEYTFINGNTSYLVVRPAGSDNFRGVINSTGKNIKSNAVSGDSLTVVGAGTNSWFIVNMGSGNWTSVE